MAGSYSWKTALAHAGLGLVAVVAAGGTLVGLGVAPGTEGFGEGVGQLAAFVGLAAYGISYLVQTGRRARGYGLLIVLVLAVVGLGVVAAQHDLVALTAADRAPLFVDGDRLQHPTLGFSVKSPGSGYQAAPQYAAMLRDAYTAPDAQYYAFADPVTPPSAVLVIAVFTGRMALARHIDGVEGGLRESASKQQLTATTVDKHVAGDEATLHLTLAEVHVRVHTYVHQTPNRGAITVSLMVMSRDEHALEDVLGSLQ